jgi:hypothetical protein
MRKRTWLGGAVIVAAGLGLTTMYLQTAMADTVTTVQIAIPSNVTVIPGQTLVVFIGKPTSTSPVTCSPGTPQPQTVVTLDPSGGTAAQITGVLAFHDHEIPNGNRYQITSDGAPCNADLKLYTGTLN